MVHQLSKALRLLLGPAENGAPGVACSIRDGSVFWRRSLASARASEADGEAGPLEGVANMHAPVHSESRTDAACGEDVGFRAV